MYAAYVLNLSTNVDVAAYVLNLSTNETYYIDALFLLSS